VVAIVALGSFVISVPARYAQLAHPTAGVRAARAKMGFSPGGYAFYNVGLDTVFAVVAIVHIGFGEPAQHQSVGFQKDQHPL
jgi:hypothetical protein